MATVDAENESDVAAPKRSVWATFRATIITESFLEKIVLLVITVVISGFAVPIIVMYINAQSVARQKEMDDARAALQKAADQAKAEQQKIIDENRARQEALVQSQSRLLRDFSEAVLLYATLLTDVSWFGGGFGGNLPNHDLQERALAQYEDRIVDLWGKWRLFISQARIVASTGVADKMDSLLLDAILLDKDMMKLRNGACDQDDRIRCAEMWGLQHQKNLAFLDKALTLIQELATELRLTRNQISQ